MRTAFLFSLSLFAALLGFIAAAPAVHAWTTYQYAPVGYTNGSYDLRNNGYECSYWCQSWNGYGGNSNYYAAPNLTAASNYGYSTFSPYQTYIAALGTTYVNADQYLSSVNSQYGVHYYGGYYSGDYYDYRSRKLPAVLQPSSSGYNSSVYLGGATGFEYVTPGVIYVGPRGNGGYTTSGSYPFVSGTIYRTY